MLAAETDFEGNGAGWLEVGVVSREKIVGRYQEAIVSESVLSLTATEKT